MPGKPEVIRSLSIAAIALVTVPLALAGPASRGTDDCGLIEVAAGRRPTLHVDNANGTLEIAKRGRALEARLDGEKVGQERIVREGHVVRILGERGRVLFMIAVFKGPGDGQLVYTPDLDPYSSATRFGFTTRAPDDEVARHLRPASGRPLEVYTLCEASPGGRAGLRQGDLIVEVDGVAGFDARRLHGAGDAARDLRVTVLRQGGTREIRLDEPSRSRAWPDADRLERYLRGALGI